MADFTIKINIKKCEQVFREDLPPGCIGTVVATIPDEQVKDMGQLEQPPVLLKLQKHSGMKW